MWTGFIEHWDRLPGPIQGLIYLAILEVVRHFLRRGETLPEMWRKEVESLRAEIRSLRTDLNTTQGKLTEAQSQYQELLVQHIAMREELAEEKRQKEQLREALREVNEKLVASDKENTQLRDNVLALQKENAKQAEILERLTKRLAQRRPTRRTEGEAKKEG